MIEQTESKGLLTARMKEKRGTSGGAAERQHTDSKLNKYSREGAYGFPTYA